MAEKISVHNRRRYIGITVVLICVGAVTTPVPSGAISPVQAGRASLSSGSKNDEKLRLELAATTMRLASVEASIVKSSERADKAALRASWFTLWTVLGTALLTASLSLFAQAHLMRHQRGINRADSEAKIANTYVEWQLKQLSEFYGPIRALLGQSNALYRQMNKALVAADSNRFRLIEGDDFDRQVFQIRSGDEWTRFRTVKHLAEVYNKNYGVEPYFDDVVEVGSRMAEVIREKAGFARSEDDVLVRIMGKYLAHFLVLKRLHERAKDGKPSHLNAADEQATFPNEIEKLVDDGFKKINRQVIEWRKLKTAMN